VLENFLSAAEHAELLRLTLAAQDRFVPSKVDADTLNYRASLVLHDDPAVTGLVTRKILEALPMVARRLAIDMGRERARAPVIECQATAHNDGDFYRVHNDSGSPLTKHRELSYVYYFRRRSGAFTGGELRVYDVVVRDGFFDAAETYSLIEPTDNSIVFFPSHAMHEVLPVSCATRLFEDSRFSVNGWIAFEDRG
jgi:SM-20-related protein